jgi:hypothetical protein
MNLKLDQEVDRRGSLNCMQWAGAAVVWSQLLGVSTTSTICNT